MLQSSEAHGYCRVGRWKERAKWKQATEIERTLNPNTASCRTPQAVETCHMTQSDQDFMVVGWSNLTKLWFFAVLQIQSPRAPIRSAPAWCQQTAWIQPLAMQLGERVPVSTPVELCKDPDRSMSLASPGELVSVPGLHGILTSGFMFF